MGITNRKVTFFSLRQLNFNFFFENHNNKRLPTERGFGIGIQ